MKRLLCAALVSITVLLHSVLAFGADLSALSIEELAELQNEVFKALEEKDAKGSFILPANVYEIGTDLKSGKFIVSPVGRSIASLRQADEKSDFDGYDWNLDYARDDEIKVYVLEEGRWFWSSDKLLFTPAEETIFPWMPGYEESQTE